MNITHDTRGEHRRLALAGIAYLTGMAVLIALSIAIYDKAFASVTWVTVQAQRAGLQLPKYGDVRMHGVLVGQIRSVTQDGHQAVIKLGLDPTQAKSIPDNVHVEILPTTLFGEKYVSLVSPKVPASTPIHNDQVIPESRVQTTVELESILANLFPLLRAVRPADLSSTLHALATALSGQGENLGRTLTQLNSYLSTMNVHLPTLRKDLTELASVAHTYALAAPDLVRLLHNATTTARTVAQERGPLSTFFANMTGMANTSTQLLRTNGPALVSEGRLAVPLLRLLDTYSPEYPCLLTGLDRYTSHLNKIFRDGRVWQTMQLNGEQRAGWSRKDRPVYGDIGHGPWCLGLPDPHQKLPYYVPLKDGTPQDNPPAGGGR